MVKCSFCQTSIPVGTGKMYVKKDGNIFYFCSNKCEKNLLKLGRNPRTTEWTGDYAKEKEARLHEHSKK